MKFYSSHSDLGKSMWSPSRPAQFPDPSLLIWNQAFAETLGLSSDFCEDENYKSKVLSGQTFHQDMEPVALAYSGHQFGQFVPVLGDGRAHLLGEIRSENLRRDLQLKGSGPTPFSRGGDGLCGLGPAVREYLMSEAMASLGVKTTRCLSVVLTGEDVFRRRMEPGAVVSRIADSHLRVGSFQFLAARQDVPGLKKLLEYGYQRFVSGGATESYDQAISFFEGVIQRQIELVIDWMRVGFIHGVMNTDNTALSGETIDYGPCAMMNRYDENTVFSSIDRRGRYRFGNQPVILQWNMARLAECFLVLCEETQQEAFVEMVDKIPRRFQLAYLEMMKRKLGLAMDDAGDAQLISDLLSKMKEHGLDYTNTFDGLTRLVEGDGAPEHLGDWVNRWKNRSKLENDPQSQYQIMRETNPCLIPRNHQVEAILAATEEQLSPEPCESYLNELRKPYFQRELDHPLMQPPRDGDQGYQTFCGT